MKRQMNQSVARATRITAWLRLRGRWSAASGSTSTSL
jgi:hypothetical protein